MSVHTLGSTTAVTNEGVNTSATYNEIINTFGFNMPNDGYVTLVAAYFGASGGGTIFGQLLLFDGSYNLLAGGTAGGQNFSGIGWHSQTLGPFFAGSGWTLHLGWFVSQGASQTFYTGNTGGWKGGNVAGPQSGGGFGQPGSPYFQAWINTYLQWIDPLSVSGVSPTVAGPGQTVTVSGAGFVGGSITGITFNGVAASSWTVNSDSSLSVVIPTGATSGALVVNSDHGSGSIAFTVSAAYVYDGSAFQTCQVYAYDGSAFQTCQVFIYDGATWQSSE